ncbi:MAG: sulfite exporter TauE/SafE family protein [Fimbriimonadaceae bacterium]|nr:sulfite exporter TauE/SafE family protein [Fimbriimonadaceae bacterium]
MATLICIIIGLIAGISSGLFGIGGGIVIVPMLIFAFEFGQRKAQGTSLVALLAPVGLLGLWNYVKADQADLGKGAWIAGGFVLGAFFGSKIAVGLDDALMRKLFAGFLVLIAIFLFFKK